MIQIANDRVRGVTAGLVLLVLGMWLVATPYYGIRHDSVLYTAQALFRLNPGVFGHDLFFRYGSQDNFTLFPMLHAWLIRGMGIDAAALSLTLLGKACWFGGLLWFASAFLKGSARWIGLALVVSYTPFFDSWKVFSYGESFATARPFAEASVLFALGFLVRGRMFTAGTAFALALLLHPLVAIPGIVAALLLHQWRSISALMVTYLGLAGIVLSMAILGLEPFSRLLVTFDPEWLGIIEQRNPYVFLDVWELSVLGRLFFLGVILGAARQSQLPVPARLAETMLMLGATMLVASWLGASVLHNVLITQLQLWRALWLIQLSALLLLGGISPQLWRGGETNKLLLVVLWSAALLEGITAGLLAVCGFAATTVARRYWPSWKPTKAIWAIAVVLVCLALFGHAMSITFNATYWSVYFDRPRWQVVASDVVPVVLLTALVASIARVRTHVSRNASLLVGVLAIAAGIFAWYDSATDRWGRETHVGVGGAESLREHIPEQATVYWPGHHETAWFWLGRAHYAGGMQMAGVLFSRETALEATRRQQRLQALALDDGSPDWGRTVPGSTNGKPSSMAFDAGAASSLCQDPVLDFIIVPDRATLRSVVTFLDPIGKTKQALIDCTSLRRSNARAD